MHQFEVNMDEYLPLRDVVFKTLRQAILKGELERGERLMEIQLAERLGVSRTPIREAIRKLELEGLVLMIPPERGRGGEDLGKESEGCFGGAPFFGGIGHRPGVPADPGGGAGNFAGAQKEFAAAVAAGDAMEIAQTDEKFHEIIYSGTGNQKLMQILSNLREQMYRYRLEYIKDANKRQILLVEHEQILKALSLRHVQEAKLAVREHIDNQEITVLKNLKEQEENDVQRKVSGRRNRVRGD